MLAYCAAHRVLFSASISLLVATNMIVLCTHRTQNVRAAESAGLAIHVAKHCWNAITVVLQDQHVQFVMIPSLAMPHMH